MSKTLVLVTLAPEDADAEAYREAIDQDEFLRERIELHFARGEEARAVIADIEIVTCGNLSPELLNAASRLRWLSFWSAGMDSKATPQLLERNLLLTNASGVHGPNIAEHVLMFMLMFTRRMDFYFRCQVEGRWGRQPSDRWGEASELSGQTLGIVGLGRIGEALAVRAASFGMRVIAVKRDPSSRHDDAKLDALYGMEALPRLLAESDHISIALPYTNETHHLFNAEMLSHCKPTAFLYNIARGRIVDEAALIAALQNGRLAGAGLDVFETEPLPADSPLWTMPNVLITPHVSGVTPRYFQRAAALFADNLKRYLKGENLNNLYEPERGY